MRILKHLCFINLLLNKFELASKHLRGFLLYKLKLSIHPVHLILIKILHSIYITSMISCANLMILKLILHSLYIVMFLPISKTDIDQFSYLMSFMIFLQSTINTFLGLMDNPIALQLRNIFKPLSISLTFLK